MLGPQQLWLLIWHLASSPTPDAPSVYLPPASCPGHHTQAYASTLPSSPYSRSSRTSLLDKVWFPPANIALAEFLVFGQQAWLNKKSKAQVTTRIHTVGTSCFVSLRILKLQNIPCCLHLTICAELSYQMNFKSYAWLGHLLVVETSSVFISVLQVP